MSKLSEEDRKYAEAGLKVLCSVQLIFENAKLAQRKGMSTKVKAMLNKLRHLSGELNKDFWKSLTESEELVFQDKLRRIEKILEE